MRDSTKSTVPINMAINRVMVITTAVAPVNSTRVGQDTLINCNLTSLIKLKALDNIFIPFQTLLSFIQAKRDSNVAKQ
jgi:hypothetical protein